MMFEVRVSYPLDLDLEETDSLLLAAAEIPHSFSGAGACRDGEGRRELGWYEENFGEAILLKNRLEQVEIEDLKVFIKEK